MSVVDGNCGARQIAVNLTIELINQGHLCVLYPIAPDHFLVCTTGHHEPIEAGSLPMANHFFGVDTAPFPAKPSAKFEVGDAVFALPYDLGAEIRLATQGYSTDHVHGELSRITNIVQVSTGVHPQISGSDSDLLLHLLSSSGSLKSRTESVATIINTDEAQYRQAFLEVQRQLVNGNTYQAVISSQARVRFQGTWLSHFRDRFGARPGRLKPYVYSGASTTLYGGSFVPHLRRAGLTVKTTVVAGTSPIHDEDHERPHTARHEAEHLMLVDLERNDLGTIAEADSVDTGKLMVPTGSVGAQYLATDVSATLRRDLRPFDVILANFARCVVTGGPKILTMVIIRNAERRSRGYYGGALGLAASGGSKLESLTILGCVLVDGDHGLIPTGGGVTIASTLDDELAEIAAKREVLLG